MSTAALCGYPFSFTHSEAYPGTYQMQNNNWPAEAGAGTKIAGSQESNTNINLIESAIVVDDAAEVVLPFDKLEPLDNLDESLVSRIRSDLQAGAQKDWRAQFTGIESVRRLLKYHGDQVNAIYAMFGADIAGIFAGNRTSLVKGALALLSETFNLASTIELHADIIRVFVKALLKKLNSNSTLKALNEWIKYVVACFVEHAYRYDVSFACFLDEPAATWHRKPDAILILQSLIRNRAASLTTLQETTLVEITRFLFAGAQQPKGQTKKVALDCLVTILNSIGESNFLSLIQYSLPTQDGNALIQALQQHIKLAHIPGTTTTSKK